MADSTIQDIRDRLDVVDVVSSYISLKRAGTNFKANCPFHAEKSGSFIVSPQKQIWHCFGCGEGGDIFGFVMKYEGLEFKEALKQLALKAGVTLPEYKGANKKDEDKEKLLYRINTFAAKYFHELLMKSPQAVVAREYVAKRGLLPETLEKWQIGYALNEYHGLEQALAEKKVNSADLVLAGVSVKNENGQIYDRFRDRVTFPIHNFYGEVVGFTARILKNDDKAAKYINSPETLIYFKSKILFGLYFAKQAIRKLDYVVIVEGQMDCIKLHQAGFINTVATSGTALTSEHLNILGRMTKNLIFCFDGDAAGMNAARRAGEIALKLGFKIKMMTLLGAKDPDELISKDVEAWKLTVKNAKWFLDVYIDFGVENFEYGSLEQKHYVQKELVSLVMSISDKFDKEHYVQKIATTFSVSEKLLVGGKTETVPSLEEKKSVLKKEQNVIDDKRILLDKQILGGLFINKDFAKFLKENAELEDFTYEPVVDVMKIVLSGEEFLDLGDPLVKESVFMMEDVLRMHEGKQLAFQNSLESTFWGLRLLRVKELQEQVMAKLKQAEVRGEAEEALKLREEFAELMKRRMEVEGRR